MKYRGLLQYPSETYLERKSRKISFDPNLSLSGPIVFNFCTEHGSDNTAFFEKIQNDWAKEMDDMDERDFARFQLTMSWGGGLSYTSTAPGCQGM